MVNYGLGVPVKVLHEAEGHIVTVEASTGETYRGTLIEAEDNMNLQVLELIILRFFVDISFSRTNSNGSYRIDL